MTVHDKEERYGENQEKKEHKYGGDPHHPDHPRNRSKKDKVTSDCQKSKPGGDPHHPDHLRNRNN